MESKTTKITTIKNEVQLQEWQKQIQAQQTSGLTVQQWCRENGINIKTYYYHLRKVRNQFIESAPSIVPLTIPETKSDIIIEKNDIKISLPSDISAEILVAVIREIC